MFRGFPVSMGLFLLTGKCYETEKALNCHRACAPAIYLTHLPNFQVLSIVLDNGNCAQKSSLLLPAIESLNSRKSAANDPDFRIGFLSKVDRSFETSAWNSECAFKFEP
jgi:hypothetical protein